MKRTILIIAALCAMSARIYAGPDFARSFFANQVSLRMTDLTALAPEKYEGEEGAVAASDTKRYAAIEPAAVIQTAEASLYSKLKDGKLSEQLVASCKAWFTKVRWEKAKDDVIGFAPEGVIVVPDDKDETLVWVVHVWERRAVLLAGRSCGGDMYQIWPGSKEAQITDPNLVKALWLLYRDAVPPKPAK